MRLDQCAGPTPLAHWSSLRNRREMIDGVCGASELVRVQRARGEIIVGAQACGTDDHDNNQSNQHTARIWNHPTPVLMQSPSRVTVNAKVNLPRPQKQPGV